MMENSQKYTKAWVPPESYVSLPVETRPQILPLSELPWDSFQRLCVRLAQRCGDVERCQEYGLPGQKQEGIDIYVHSLESSRYSVWQLLRRTASRNTPSSPLRSIVAWSSRLRTRPILRLSSGHGPRTQQMRRFRVSLRKGPAQRRRAPLGPDRTARRWANDQVSITFGNPTIHDS